MKDKKPNKKKSVSRKSTKTVNKSTPKKSKTNKLKSRINIIQEKNDYVRPLLCLGIIVLFLLSAYFILISTDKGKELLNGNSKVTEDEKKFKNDFESLNKNNVVTVEIKEDNNVTYLNIDQVLEKLDKGSGFILFGNSNDTNTRLVISNIIDNIGDNDLYYFDIFTNGEDIRDEYVLDEGKPKMVRDGKKGYRELLLKLNDYLNDYYLYMNGKKVEVGERRLEIPLLIKVKDGKVEDAVLGTGTISDYKEFIK